MSWMRTQQPSYKNAPDEAMALAQIGHLSAWLHVQALLDAARAHRHRPKSMCVGAEVNGVRCCVGAFIGEGIAGAVPVAVLLRTDSCRHMASDTPNPTQHAAITGPLVFSPALLQQRSEALA